MKQIDKENIEKIRAWYCDYSEAIILVVEMNNGDYFETEIELWPLNFNHVPEGC